MTQFSMDALTKLRPLGLQHLIDLPPTLVKYTSKLVPQSIQQQLIAKHIEQLLTPLMEAEELNFLVGKQIRLLITDLELCYQLKFNGQSQQPWLVDACPKMPADVTFSIDSKDLILVLAAKEDPDTLFFQRRLTIEGHTELGLEVKNLLLSLELSQLPWLPRVSLEALATSLTRLQSLLPPATSQAH